MTELKRNETKKYFTARPKLASYLFDKGFEGKRTTNPYDPNRAAWVFTQTDALLKCVSEYFKEDKQ